MILLAALIVVIYLLWRIKRQTKVKRYRPDSRAAKRIRAQAIARHERLVAEAMRARSSK